MGRTCRCAGEIELAPHWAEFGTDQNTYRVWCGGRRGRSSRGSLGGLALCVDLSPNTVGGGGCPRMVRFCCRGRLCGETVQRRVVVVRGARAGCDGAAAAGPRVDLEMHGAAWVGGRLDGARLDVHFAQRAAIYGCTHVQPEEFGGSCAREPLAHQRKRLGVLAAANRCKVADVAVCGVINLIAEVRHKVWRPRAAPGRSVAKEANLHPATGALGGRCKLVVGSLALSFEGRGCSRRARVRAPGGQHVPRGVVRAVVANAGAVQLLRGDERPRDGDTT